MNRRPLGLSLIIVVCMLLYVALPLMGVLYPWMIENRFRFGLVQRPEGLEAPIETGSELSGAGSAQIVFSLVFAVVLVLAWRGRPAWVRWTVAGLALLQAAWLVVSGLQILTGPPPATVVEEAVRGAQPAAMAGAVLFGLFVSWYFNRAPAVAFFTGEPIQYIEDDLTEKGKAQ